MRNAVPMSILSVFDFYLPAIDITVYAGFGGYCYVRKTYHNQTFVWLYSENNKEVNEPQLAEDLETEFQKLLKAKINETIPQR